MKPTAYIAMLAITCSMAFFANAAQAQVAADGAAGANVQYESGKAKYWYIEEQRAGVGYIEDGIDEENPALIDEGLLILDWGFKREGADGSYPGTGDGTVGEPFHSTSLFIEAAARATLELENYAPVTYTLSKSTYSAKIAQYKQNIHKTAEWLIGATDPSVPTNGQKYNQPYTHRRYLLGAALQEAAVLTGDSSLTPIADTYIDAGLSLQLPSGWTAAIGKAVKGVYPPATLIAPGKPLPAGTTQSFSAAGVDPEANGYDVNYQAFGLEFAELWLENSPAGSRADAVKNALKNGLNWESSQVASTGEVNPIGNSRVGLEKSPDGSVKTISPSLISGAFLMSIPILGTEFDSVGQRVADYPITINSTSVASDGAAGENATWETGKSKSWEIGLQACAGDWIAAGVSANNPNYIQKGLSMLDWGFAHQSSNGSFGTSDDLCFGTVEFVEAAARSTIMLKSFNATKYASNISRYTTKIGAATEWLTGSEASRVSSALSKSVADEYAAATALAEAAAVTGKTAYTTDAVPYAQKGMSMQLSNGENPENGAADPSWQAIGVLYAEWYYGYASTATKNSLVGMITKALDWEAGNVNVDGDINGKTPIRSVGYAFANGASITGDQAFQVIANRVEND